jgi:hypothetical protein
MSRRSLLVTAGIFLLVVCGVGGVLWLLARHEPAAYLQATVPPGEQRKQHAHDFLMEASHLYNSVLGQKDEAPWDAKFTQDEVNSYLAENFVVSGLEQQWLSDSIQQPRVVFEPNKARVMFRYGRGLWSTVVSLELRIWVARDEANSIAVQVLGLHAGAMPISAQSLLDPMVEAGRQHGIDVTWYRHEGCPVAVLRFQPDYQRPTLALQTVQVEQGSILIQGRFNDTGDAPTLPATVSMGAGE